MVQLMLQMTLPEAAAKDAVEALRSVMLSARFTSNCIRAQVLASPEASEEITYIEEWPSDDVLAQRIRTDQFVTLLAVMEAAAAPPTLEFRVISEVRGLEFVEAVRSQHVGESL